MPIVLASACPAPSCTSSTRSCRGACAHVAGTCVLADQLHKGVEGRDASSRGVWRGKKKAKERSTTDAIAFIFLGHAADLRGERKEHLKAAFLEEFAPVADELKFRH